MTVQTTPLPQPQERGAWLALAGGVLFSLAFTALIAWANQFIQVPLLPDQGASWYYWKLPEPTVWSRLTAWGGYTLHQLALWGVIYWAQASRARYTRGLHKFNIAALAVNAGFISLHFLQTHLWYDGLAQDVSIWSSQWSVIIMLVWILLMENSRRGLFFGKKAPVAPDILGFARKYHGYVFAWATVYTFWYHPTVSTPSHLLGFLYMFFLLLQGSLFFTRAHVNKWWMVTQEVMVFAHGTLVAITQGQAVWPMFAFGFGGLFIITQMHGLGLSARVKWLLAGGYVAAAIAVYSQVGWAQVPMIVAIPATEYLSVVVLALLIGGGLWLNRRLRPRQPNPPIPAGLD